MKKGIAAVLIAALLAVATPPVLGFWVFQQLGTRLKAKVSGHYSPVWFSTSFKVSELDLQWDGKVQLHSGEVTVDYDPLTVFFADGLRVRISGKKIPVSLLGPWAHAAASPDVMLDDFFADITIGRGGVKEIHAVQAKSPEIQFQIGTNL